MSTVNVNTIKPITDDVHLSLQAGGSTQMYITSAGALSGTGGSITNFTGVGKVLQVVSVTDDTNVSSSGTEHATGISASITPSSSSSKILVRICASVSSSNVDSSPGIYIYRTAPSTADIARADADSNHQRVGTSGHPRDSGLNSLVTEGLDSPSTTSQCTYELYVTARSGYTTHVNRTHNNADAQYDNTGATTITLMEIAG